MGSSPLKQVGQFGTAAINSHVLGCAVIHKFQVQITSIQTFLRENLLSLPTQKGSRRNFAAVFAALRSQSKQELFLGPGNKAGNITL